jgi:hypothetical protein
MELLAEICVITLNFVLKFSTICAYRVASMRKIAIQEQMNGMEPN